MRLVEPLVAPYLGTGRTATAVAILMPDLSHELIAWERGPSTTRRSSVVLDAVARLHAMPWADYRRDHSDWDWPWCPLRERLLLLSRPSAESYRAEGLAVGERFLAGWDAFDRQAPRAARDTGRRASSADPAPLLAALGRLPSDRPPRRPQARERRAARRRPGGAHRLADDVARARRGRARLAARLEQCEPPPHSRRTSWRRTARRPCGPRASRCRWVGRGWSVPRAACEERDPDRLPPRGLDATIGDWDAQLDLTWIVGLLLRGWRKGLDAEAGDDLASGVSAADDLAWWCDRAVEAAGRRL